ncbi:uncharacterized protein L969DRAFT_94078 [Mixia osmundae IAM 14324]|uniref:Fe2OG dioxygenase domain-containing protein n=1 Tax=Mixia osmundae (strain CBS 9802 / IAM 14324 / JCM 22182 / KY 12970) TaxID=764103 RepID=G7E910_MIXOS|nr:uncharacterized protein L969DRAFT_94078 [Mixia osmundae IAM 14324]KEI40263.1 hypothetical protein L969DRAFT_94078 [Mixia osmundae IAM 14324]GAA99628.1 hypothetical protein E5Q_06329 [Mixia osmundae IAM 14324]
MAKMTKRRDSDADAEPAIKPSASKRARKTVDASEFKSAVVGDDLRLPLTDAEIFYLPDFVSVQKAEQWLRQIAKIDGWYRPTLKMYGREITQSREIAAYATDRSLSVKYSGTTVQMRYDYPPVLREIQRCVEAQLETTFNHVMLNKYDSGNVYIGKHADNLENRVIASVSLGAERTFILSHKKPPTDSPAKATGDPFSRAKRANHDVADPYHRSLKLASGSLLVMQGETQQHWKHEIPKEPRVKHQRISLTFRQLVF